jgi:DNA-binding NtrC family response regulator
MIRVGLFSKDLRLSSALSSTLGREFAVSPVSIRERARALAQESAYDVWIVDADSAHDPLSQWRSLLEDSDFSREVPVIIMTTDEHRQDAMEAAVNNEQDCIRKPPVISELKLRLKKAYEGQLLKGELESVRRQVHLQRPTGLDQLTGSSTPMLGVYDLIRRVAKLDASVLVTGESGTGKELVARAIHNLGNRANRPFVALSCGAIPETLIEAELFGHEKGAFTGTVGAREGYLEKAGDGTLFFDEIGELSPATQVKLLRVLQQREFCRLGSSRPIPLRARIVFATHRDLATLVAEGRFRQDLFYRINVMNIRIPALRDRAEDIPALAEHFLRKYSELYRKAVGGIESDALVLLRNYSWPGNVRELENVIQHAIIMAETEFVHIYDLPQGIQDQEIARDEDDLPEGSFERLLRDYKLKLVRDAIAQCNGNKTLAAQSLSISRAYLHRLIRPASGAMLEEVRLGGIGIDACGEISGYGVPAIG